MDNNRHHQRASVGISNLVIDLLPGPAQKPSCREAVPTSMPWLETSSLHLIIHLDLNSNGTSSKTPPHTLLTKDTCVGTCVVPLSLCPCHKIFPFIPLSMPQNFSFIWNSLTNHVCAAWGRTCLVSHFCLSRAQHCAAHKWALWRRVRLRLLLHAV
jgi:hypothetical protein